MIPSRFFIILLLFPLMTSTAQAEWLIFADATAIARKLPEDFDQAMKTREFKPSLTLFGNINRKNYQMLVEAVAHPDKAKLERLQLGWNINPYNTLWLGRFHNPFDYWSERFHHGLYFQTSQLRPGIVEFEDNGGVMPIHLSGLLLKGFHLTSAMAGIRYDLALGTGPKVTRAADGSELKTPGPTAALTRAARDSLAASARLAYLPDAAGENEIGLFISRTIMPTENLPTIRGNVTQWASGLFGHWQGEQFKLLGASIIIRHTLDMAMNGQDNRLMSHMFSNQYLQGEYTFKPRWHSYSRIEATQGSDDDEYIQSFAMFIKKRFLLGLRYDYLRHQAIRVEASRAEHQHDNTAFTMLAIQWSALLP